MYMYIYYTYTYMYPYTYVCIHIYMYLCMHSFAYIWGGFASAANNQLSHFTCIIISVCVYSAVFIWSAAAPCTWSVSLSDSLPLHGSYGILPPPTPPLTRVDHRYYDRSAEAHCSNFGWRQIVGCGLVYVFPPVNTSQQVRHFINRTLGREVAREDHVKVEGALR